MKFGLGAAVLLLTIGAAAAGQNSRDMSKWRLADAASDACFANCASQERFLQGRLPGNAQHTLP